MCAARDVMDVFECARLCKAHGTVPLRFHTAGEVVCPNLDKLRYVIFVLQCLCCHVSPMLYLRMILFIAIDFTLKTGVVREQWS